MLCRYFYGCGFKFNHDRKHFSLSIQVLINKSLYPKRGLHNNTSYYFNNSKNYVIGNSNEEGSIPNEHEVIEIPDSDEEVTETSTQVTPEHEEKFTEREKDEAEIPEKRQQTINTFFNEDNADNFHSINSKESLVKEKMVVEEDREVQEILNAAIDSADELSHKTSLSKEKILIKSKKTCTMRAKSVPLGKSSASFAPKIQTSRGKDFLIHKLIRIRILIFIFLYSIF